MTIRIGILSPFCKDYNYGDKLQAYALTEFLRRQGAVAEQIQYDQPGRIALFDEGRNRRRLWNSSSARRKLRQQTLGRCMPARVCSQVEARCQAMDAFDDLVPHTAEIYSDGSLGRLNGVYDGYVVGSGPVWNPASWKRGYFFSFLSGGNYCFSYAASIANALSPLWESYFAAALGRLNGVSVREKTAQHMAERVLQRQVSLSVDPILLLERADWAVLAEPIGTKGPYLFCFFEGYSQSMRRSAQHFAKRRGLQIVTMPHLQAASGRYYAQDLRFGDQRLYAVSPGQLVTLVEQAECIMTDSYHVTALSLLFKKPFLVFEREGQEHMGSRLQDLLCLFRMEDRYAAGMTWHDVIDRMEEPMMGYWEKPTDFEARRSASVEYLASQLAAVENIARAKA